MNKIALSIILLYSSYVYPSECINLNYGEPRGFTPETVKICHKAYIVYYDEKVRYTPNVSYILNKDNGISCLSRENTFKEDPELKKSPISLDYEDSDFDRGHLSPYLDNNSSEETAKESFYMTNVSPQYPGLNRGVWKSLENYVRILSYENNTNLVIYVGGIVRNLDLKIGITKIDVPPMFYKIIIDTTTKKYWGFIFPNERKLKKDISFYQTSIKDIENKSGLIFPIPGDKDKIYEVKELSSKKYVEDRREKCSR